MKAFNVLSISTMLVLSFLAASKNAKAQNLTLNGSFSCGTAQCLGLTNTSANPAIRGTGAIHGVGVRGQVTSGGNDSAGVSGDSGTGRGVLGTTSTGFGIRGEATSATGVGVYGLNSTGTAISALSNSGFAVYGQSSGGDASHPAVTGQADGIHGVGVRGKVASGGNDSAGVSGDSGTGRGVLGTTSTGFGVRGEATSAFGVGVYGLNSTGTAIQALSNSGFAVYAETTGGDASHAAVTGQADVGGGTAIRGITSGTGNGSGVWGTGPVNGFGVFGEASGTGYGVYGFNGGTGYGVYGYNQTGGYAGYFVGPAFTSSGMWSSSDVRLKKDIKDAPYGLDQLLKMRPVTYTWKEGGDHTAQLGLIAQEIQKIIPEVVHADGPSQMLSINYPALLPVVIKAAQEQQKVIQRLEDRIATLERRNRPSMSSLSSGGIGAGVALGLLPLGLFVVIRRRKDQKA